MPTAKMLERVELLFPSDDKGEMAAEQHEKMRAYIEETLTLYQHVCLDGTATVDLEKWLSLSESCVLLTALDKKWSNEVRYKCVCERFFREAACEHVVLLCTFISPAAVVPPEETDIRVTGIALLTVTRHRSAVDLE